MGIFKFFDKFYEETSGTPAVGDIYWVPTPFIQECPRLLSTKRRSPERHDEVDFTLERIGPSHYRGERDLPIQLLKLEAREELMAIKSKRRPCVVVAKSNIGPSCFDSLPKNEAKLAKHLSKEIYLVAPLFSCSHINKPTSFGAELVKRIRLLNYEHLFCLPDFRGKICTEPRSIVRLDYIQPSFLGTGCETTGKKLSGEFLAFFMEYVNCYVSGSETEFLKELRQILE